MKTKTIVITVLAIAVLACIGYECYRSYQKKYGYDPCEDEYLNDNIYIRFFNDNTVRLYNSNDDLPVSEKIIDVSREDSDEPIFFQSLDGLYGFLDSKTGKILIEPTFREASRFADGLAAVAGEDGLVSFIDVNGNVVIKTSYEWSYSESYDFSKGWCILTAPEGVGIMDKTGNWVVAPEYDEIFWKNEKKDSYFIVKGGLKRLVSRDGTILVPFVIDRTYPLSYSIGYNSEGESVEEIVPNVVGIGVGSYEGLMDSRTGRVLVQPTYWELKAISKTLILATLSYEEDGAVVLNIADL